MFVPKFAVIASIIVFLLLSATSIMSVAALVETRETAANTRVIAVNNNRAMCAVSDYYEDRIVETKTYLKEHPEEEPIPGITRATLKRGLESNLGLVDALEFATCPGEEVKKGPGE
jgi:hypothetical protein